MSVKISFSGHMGSGKDTIGNEIKKIFEKDFKKRVVMTSFGKALKTEAQVFLDKSKELNKKEILEYFNITEEDYNNVIKITNKIPLGESLKNRSPNIRKFLQYWGTEVRRKQSPNYWVEKVREEILEEEKIPNTVIIITDSRFLNEIKMTEEENFIKVLLDIPEDIVKERIFKRDGIILSSNALSHPSEQEFKKYIDYDIIVKNGFINIQETINIILYKILKNIKIDYI